MAGALKAPVVHALRGKEFVEYDNPYDVGMAGLLRTNRDADGLLDELEAALDARLETRIVAGRF